MSEERAGTSGFDHARRPLVRAFGLLPRRLRLGIVRLLAPRFIVGASAVIEHEGALLVVRSAYRPGWGFPGGLVDRGEGPAETAVREVREETAIEIELLGSAATVVDVRTRRVDFVFRARPRHPSPTVVIDPVEIAEARWAKADALPALQVEAAAALDALKHRQVSPWVMAADHEPGWLG